MCTKNAKSYNSKTVRYYKLLSNLGVVLEICGIYKKNKFSVTLL